MIFLPYVHLLADKQITFITIHPLGGLCANRPRTPNPQSGAAQPTQDRDPQATGNPLVLPYVTSLGEGLRTHHNQHDQSWRQTPPFGQ
jgi:hypothetical protein